MPNDLIKTLQEEGRGKLMKKSEVINDSLWYVNPADIDSLISNAVERGRREVLDEAEMTANQHPQMTDCKCHECIKIRAKREFVSDLLSKFRSDRE